MKPIGFNPNTMRPPELISAMAELRKAADRIAAANRENAVRSEVAKMNLKPLVFSNGVIA